MQAARSDSAISYESPSATVNHRDSLSVEATLQTNIEYRFEYRVGAFAFYLQPSVAEAEAELCASLISFFHQ